MRQIEEYSALAVRRAEAEWRGAVEVLEHFERGELDAMSVAMHRVRHDGEEVVPTPEPPPAVPPPPRRLLLKSIVFIVTLGGGAHRPGIPKVLPCVDLSTCA